MTVKAPEHGQAVVPGRDYDALRTVLQEKDAEIARLRKVAGAARVIRVRMAGINVCGDLKKLFDALAELDGGNHG